MTKVLGILGMMMVFGGSAQAGIAGLDLVCHGDNGEQLTVDYLQTRSQAIAIFANLTKDNVTQKFHGTSEFGNTTYQMNDVNGEKLSLVIKSVFDHGGRCGRCAPSNNIETYAKLTVGAEEINFNCN